MYYKFILICYTNNKNNTLSEYIDHNDKMTMLVGKNVEDFDIPLSILNIDIHYNYDYALRRASYNGYLSVVKFLVVKGADIQKC